MNAVNARQDLSKDMDFAYNRTNYILVDILKEELDVSIAYIIKEITYNF